MCAPRLSVCLSVCVCHFVYRVFVNFSDWSIKSCIPPKKVLRISIRRCVSYWLKCLKVYLRFWFINWSMESSRHASRYRFTPAGVVLGNRPHGCYDGCLPFAWRSLAGERLGGGETSSVSHIVARYITDRNGATSLDSASGLFIIQLYSWIPIFNALETLRRFQKCVLSQARSYNCFCVLFWPALPVRIEGLT